MNVENATAEERILAEQVASYWFRHAAYGNPNGKANRAETLTWPRYETKSEQYLQLDVKSMGGIRAVRKPFRSETCDFFGEWIAIASNASASMAVESFVVSTTFALWSLQVAW